MWTLGILRMQGYSASRQTLQYAGSKIQWRLVTLFSKEVLDTEEIWAKPSCVSLGPSAYFGFSLLSHREIRFCSSFEVLTDANIKITVFWDVMPCSLVNRCQNFGGMCYLYLQGEEWITSQSNKTDLQSWESQKSHNDNLWVLYATSAYLNPLYWPYLLPWRWRQHVPRNVCNDLLDYMASHPWRQ
jgi:hypothetical protein